MNRISPSRRTVLAVAGGALVVAFGSTAALASPPADSGGTQAQGKTAVRAAAQPTVVTADGRDGATATCPAGSYATGGGYKVTEWKSINGSPVFADESHPTADGTGWYVHVESISPKITAYAVCSS